MSSYLSATDAISLYRRIIDTGIPIWIDGGWAVDALLGEQTRPHEDLDIVVEQADVPRLRELLHPFGFQEIAREDMRPWNFVLADERGRMIDIHAVVFDHVGNGLYGPIEKGVMYPAGSLDGRGKIDDQVVSCIAVAHLVDFHIGYELRSRDFHDVCLLCERFGLSIPEEYQDRIHGDAS
jgi:lincosamide nucleotidyltransferase A/C/D/E